ncbi:MAG: COX15/CtaA family protein [Candidatus Heimdallarchaeota archaeon]|nr:COX15/CtaA family protein [Candidatus Heimdallarchaeota archaeon]
MDYVSERYTYLSYGLVVTTFILILLGGYVKAISAGLACPDWPMCHGQLIPDLSDRRIFAEWFHRLWAMINGFYMIGIAVLSYKLKSINPTLFNLSLIATFLYTVQVWLGGLTVLGELEPVIVVMHLGNALLIIILQLTIAFVATTNTEKFMTRVTEFRK